MPVICLTDLLVHTHNGIVHTMRGGVPVQKSLRRRRIDTPRKTARTFRLTPGKVETAQRILAARTATDAIETALDMVIFQKSSATIPSVAWHRAVLQISGEVLLKFLVSREKDVDGFKATRRKKMSAPVGSRRTDAEEISRTAPLGIPSQQA